MEDNVEKPYKIKDGDMVLLENNKTARILNKDNKFHINHMMNLYKRTKNNNY